MNSQSTSTGGITITGLSSEDTETSSFSTLLQDRPRNGEHAPMRSLSKGFSFSEAVETSPSDGSGDKISNHSGDSA